MAFLSGSSRGDWLYNICIIQPFRELLWEKYEARPINPLRNDSSITTELAAESLCFKVFFGIKVIQG